VDIHNILLWLNEGMETPAPMINDILNNSLPLQSTHQSDAASNLSRPALLYSGLVAELCRRFCSQLDWGQGCSCGRKSGSL